MLTYHKSLVTDINILPDRAYYIPSGAKYTELTQWNFTYFPEETDEIFSCFGKETVVPSCWQIERKQDIQYTNVRFPFPYCPPDILKANPCGVYVTNLNVKEILSDKQFYINFDGVDSCYYLYVNGSFVSYCSISHRHSESNITKYLRVGDNELRVIVFKWNCSSYLEDQDKIRLSGIFNKVYILERNTDHICNYRIDTRLTSQNEAIVSITSDKNCNYALSVDEKNIVKESGITATFVIKSPNLWSAEIPNLYKLNIEYNGETIYENVGIRKIEIKNKQVLLNGKPIKLYGVNRHSMTINGYVETEDDLVNDILLLKKLNVNAVRTSHYPPSPRFPALCDKYGLYLMEEADCECHGVVTQNGSDGTEDYSLYCDIAKNPIFCEQIVKRATSMVVRDYNRPSVIFWSLGNESGWGDNFVQSGKAVKRLDTSRLLHYEGTFNYLFKRIGNKIFHHERIMDVYSCMYAPKELVKQLLPFLSRPLVLCEYSHAMGNSCGDLKDYWRILGDSPKFVGGFIWEMINHSIIDGDKVLYGGDFGDNQNDSNFCMDGLVSIDRKPFTESLQVREVYAPIKVIENETNYTIKNKYFFATLKDISCNLSVTVNGKITDEYNIDITKIPPQGEMIVPKRVLHLPNGYAYINFVFEKNGERVATCQFERKNALIEQKCFDMKPINTTLFDSNGLLKGMSLNMYRAPLDNDMTTKEVWKRASIDKAVFFPISKELVGDSLIVEGKIVTDFMSPLGNMKIIYRAYNNSSLNVDVTAHLEDFLLNKQSTNKGGILKNNVDYIPRFGFTFAYDKKDIFSVSYFGRGKQEAYVDRNLYAPIGLYTSKPSEMFVSYPKPQENGSHCDTRFVVLSGINLMFDSATPFSFSISPIAISDYPSHSYMIDKSSLTTNGKWYFNLDYKMSGLGSNSCGPELDTQYRLKEKDIHFNFTIKRLTTSNYFERHFEQLIK